MEEETMLEVAGMQLDEDLDTSPLSDDTIEPSAAYIGMDFSLETPEERVDKVKEIINNVDKERLTPAFLEKLSNYILFAADKQERRERKIMTDNRMVTINKREFSYEGLVGKLENGEDGIYNMIANDKNIIFRPNAPITQKDIEEIPHMRELVEEIKKLEVQVSQARGKRAYLLRKQLIELRQNQYDLKNCFVKPFRPNNIVKSVIQMDLRERVYLDENGQVKSTATVNFYDIKHVSMLLCNYSRLKEDSWERNNSDIKWMLYDFENLIDRTFEKEHPLLYKIIIYKIDGKQNSDIQELIEEEFGVKHSVEYISSLWRQKIPKMIVEQATKEWLEYHYTFEEKGYWKKCSRCGEIKLGHNLFFSKNTTSRDHFYSICKCCRNKKK